MKCVLSPATELMLASKTFLDVPADLPRGTSGEAHPLQDAAHRRLRAAVEALPVEGLTGPLLTLRIAAEMALRATRSAAGARAARRILERCRAEYCVHVRAAIGAMSWSSAWGDLTPAGAA